MHAMHFLLFMSFISNHALICNATIITTMGLISLSKCSFLDYVNETLKGMFCFTSLFADQVVQIILWSSIYKKNTHTAILESFLKLLDFKLR